MNNRLLIDLFNTDSDLLSKYHILAPNTAEVCAKRTIEDLGNSEIFLIKNDDNIIGYYGIEGSSLTGFFIKPENRDKKTISQFWNEVESRFTKDYYCGLYNKNTRAIKFIRQKSIEEYPVKEWDGIFFKIKR